MLKNLKYANKPLETIYGRIEFDEKGISSDLTLEQAKEVAKIKGFEVIEKNFQDKPKKKDKNIKEEVELVGKKPEKEPVRKKSDYTKNQLNSKTVSEIEAIAEKDFGVKLEDGVKKEKIEQVLKAQKQRG